MQKNMQDSFKSMETSRSEGIQEVYREMGMPEIGEQMARSLLSVSKPTI